MASCNIDCRRQMALRAAAVAGWQAAPYHPEIARRIARSGRRSRS